MQLEFCKKHLAVVMILLPDRGQKCIALAVTSGVGGGGGRGSPPRLEKFRANSQVVQNSEY